METSLITISQEVLSGRPVFKGTRVPIESLFDHLKNGVGLDEFLEDFPSVSKEQAVQLLALSEALLTTNLNLLSLKPPA